MTRRSGFTLVELLVVIGIIAILAGLSFVVFRAGQDAADQITEDVEIALIKLNKKALPPPKGKAVTPIPNQFLFVFDSAVADAQAEVRRLSHVAAFRVVHVYDAPQFKGFSARLSALDMNTLLQDRAIKGAEQDHRVALMRQTVPRGISRMNVNSSYNGTKNGAAAPANKNGIDPGKPVWSNVVVAVMDTGVDVRHPDLNVVFSRGFVDGDAADIADGEGHGTHVAGTIGAFNNGIGVVGVAPAVRIHNLKVLDGEGSGSYADLLAALSWVQAHAHEIHVVNLSLGGPHSNTVNHAIDACVSAGVVMVVAAGNDARPANGSPASASRAIAVAALADSDGQSGGKGNSTFGKDDSFATFSNYGPHVKFVAPGVNILSTVPGKKGSYGIMSGTSMASPHVAGLAARIHNAALDPTAPGASTYFPGRTANTRATPADVLRVMRTAAQESIPGRFDSLQYKVINASGL